MSWPWVPESGFPWDQPRCGKGGPGSSSPLSVLGRGPDLGWRQAGGPQTGLSFSCNLRWRHGVPGRLARPSQLLGWRGAVLIEPLRLLFDLSSLFLEHSPWLLCTVPSYSSSNTRTSGLSPGNFLSSWIRCPLHVLPDQRLKPGEQQAPGSLCLLSAILETFELVGNVLINYLR